MRREGENSIRRRRPKTRENMFRTERAWIELPGGIGLEVDRQEEGRTEE